MVILRVVYKKRKGLLMYVGIDIDKILFIRVWVFWFVVIIVII